MEPRVERERFLEFEGMVANGAARHEDEVPAVSRYSTRYCNEAMLHQQAVAKTLLTRTRYAWVKPVRIGNTCRVNDMYRGRVADDRRGQCVGNRVECPKPFVDGDFEDCGGRIQ